MRRVIPVRVDCEVVVPIVLPDGFGRVRVFCGGKKVEYNLKAIKDERGEIAGFEVIKDDGPTYAVNVQSEDWTCECGDFEWRRRQKDQAGCKHIISLRMYLALLGLLDQFNHLPAREDEDQCTYSPWEE